MRRLAPLALALASLVTGCNGSSGLTVVGEVTVDAAGTPTGFRFPQAVRLDGAAPAGSVTGSCTATRLSGSNDYGVVVDLYGPDSAEGVAVRSITFMTRSDAQESATVEAELGSTSYRGTCTVSIPRVSGDMVEIETSGCSIASDTTSATVDATLHFEGCTITSS